MLTFLGPDTPHSELVVDITYLTYVNTYATMYVCTYVSMNGRSE